MNTEITDALGIKQNTTGVVIFYQANHKTKIIKEIRRSWELPFEIAMEIYAETPNPASQLLQWSTEEEKEQVMKQHALDIQDPKWLEDLFECI